MLDTLTVMQLFFVSHNMGKDSTCLDYKDTFLQAFLSNSLGKPEGAECYCGPCGNRTENNDHLGIHIQVGHGLEMEIEVCAMDLDGRAVGECSETGTHTRACC